MIIISLPGDQVPVSIVPRTKARVIVGEDLILYIVGNRKMKYDQVKNFIQSALNDCLERTIADVEIWISIHVPKRGGELIKNLLKFLRRSRPPPATVNELRGVRLILGVGAEIDYAKYVNKMVIANVRHFNTWLENSGKKAYSKGKPVLLNDPRAVGYFFDKMVEHGKERFKINLAKAKYELQNTTNITSRNISKIQVTES